MVGENLTQVYQRHICELLKDKPLTLRETTAELALNYSTAYTYMRVLIHRRKVKVLYKTGNVYTYALIDHPAPAVIEQATSNKLTHMQRIFDLLKDKPLTLLEIATACELNYATAHEYMRDMVQRQQVKTLAKKCNVSVYARSDWFEPEPEPGLTHWVGGNPFKRRQTSFATMLKE